MDYSDVTLIILLIFHSVKKTYEINHMRNWLNHCPFSINQLPLSIKIYLSKLSLHEKNFKNSIPIYKHALAKADYKHKLKYQKQHQRKKSYNIAKGNLFSLASITVNMLRQKQANFFLSLHDMHLPPHHMLQELFNQDNVKISASCLPNIKPVKHAHSRKIWDTSPSTARNIPNCINIS